MKPNPRRVILRYVLLPLMVAGLSFALFIAGAKKYPSYVAVGVGLLFAAGALNAWRLRRKNEQRGWRAHRHGRDEFVYEELIDGKWARIVIGGEMLVGKPRHVIYLPTEEEWNRLPAWARNRQTEIISRLKLEHPEPEYVYQEANQQPPGPSRACSPVTDRKCAEKT
jgi:hypothetical protein